MISINKTSNNYNNVISCYQERICSNQDPYSSKEGGCKEGSLLPTKFSCKTKKAQRLRKSTLVFSYLTILLSNSFLQKDYLPTKQSKPHILKSSCLLLLMNKRHFMMDILPSPRLQRRL